MNGHDLLSFSFWKLIQLAREFIILYLCIFLGEWFAEKRGLNLFERSWVIVIIVLTVLTLVIWKSLGRLLLFSNT